MNTVFVEGMKTKNIRKYKVSGNIVTFLAWTTEAGFPAILNYNKDLGFYCGYVGIPRSHPLYGAPYHKQNKFIKPLDSDEPVGKRGLICILLAGGIKSVTRPDIAFDVHGGLTYSNKLGKYLGSTEDFPDKVLFTGYWWFGFDCGHAGDALHPEIYRQRQLEFPNQPFMGYPIQGDVFRDVPYVVEECESLARQLILRVRWRNPLEWMRWAWQVTKEWWSMREWMRK